VASLTRGDFKQHTDEEYQWLGNLDDNTGTVDNDNTSWAAFHASRQPPGARVVCPTSLLPLFLESAHTVAMIRHSMDVVKNAVKRLNPVQTPVVTFDQPLFALAKQIQWKWPESFGEDQIVVMFGGLHIEMVALDTGGLAARERLGASTCASRDCDSRDSRLIPASIPRLVHKKSTSRDCSSTVHPATPCLQPLLYGRNQGCREHSQV